MALKVRKAAVLGAGVMGAQIAAHLAAAGVQTYLLDLATDKGPEDKKLAKVVGKNIRSTPAILAIHNLQKLKPSPLASQSILGNLIPGNFDDDMSVLADCDWVIEAVIERMDIKKSILKKIAEYAPAHIPITSNTSGLSMAAMCEDMDDSFQSRFFGTHFFNPPRYMKLLEIVPHQKNDMEMVSELSNWIETRLGKGIVNTKDTINFIANRIGTFNMQATLKHMDDLSINIETVDALTGKMMGRPASATIRTMDVVGIDTFAHVARNVYDYAPNDPYRDWFLPPKWIADLIEKGSLGQKTGSKGAYLKTKEQGKTKILAYRPQSGEYEEQSVTLSPWMAEAKKIPDTIERIKFVISQSDDNANFVWRVLRDTLAYSAILLEEIADNNPQAVDNCIKWGFNWQWGPFEMWQALGFDEVHKRMLDDGCQLPSWVKNGISFYQPTPNSPEWHQGGAQSQYQGSKESFVEIKPQSHLYYLPKTQSDSDKRVVLSSPNVSLVDIGDGVACLTFHSKMNALNTDICEHTIKAVEKVKADFEGLVIGNEGEVFSAGADLREILGACKASKFEDIDMLLRKFQGAVQMIKHAPFPSVSCPHGLTLGGGCEVALHAHRQLLAGDTFAGLVEVGVGLIPGGGGTKELALRSYELAAQGENADPMPFLQRAFLLIGMGKTSSSGLDAIEMGLFPKTASYTLSKDHQIDRAKSMVLEMNSRGFVPTMPKQGIKVLGDPGIQTFKMMLFNMQESQQISAYDAFIGEKVATVLCGGEIDGGQLVSEEYLLELERRVFVELCREQKTQDRIEYMLKNGKPLRN